MNIHWDSLLVVFVVSLSSAVAVVVLVATAVLGLSARSHPATRQPRFSGTSGGAVPASCLVGAAAIVLFGLWAIVAN